MALENIFYTTDSHRFLPLVFDKSHMERILSLVPICLYTSGLIGFAAAVLASIYLFTFPRSREIILTSSDRPLPLSGGGTSLSLVVEHCKSFNQGFKPSWWLPTSHAQTIYSAVANFSNEDHVEYQRHLLRLPDGGTIGLDVFPPLSTRLPPNAPLVIMNHGLTGGSHESYIRNLVIWVTKPWEQGGLGGRAAVVNFRGCASTPITSPHLYSSGTTLDTHTATMYFASLLPQAPILGAGFSLGAAVLTRYLGEQVDRCRLRAATILCCPLELRETSAKLDSPNFFPRLYSLAMAHKMLRSLSPHLFETSPLVSPSSHLHPYLSTISGLPTKYKWTLRASHVTEFVVAKVGGSSPLFPFADLQEFLAWACPSGWIAHIRRPTLALSALDDPIITGDCLPLAAVRASSHFVLASVPQGGHLGWFDGPLIGSQRHHRWHTKPVMEFLRGAITDLRKEYDLRPVEVSIDQQGWHRCEGAAWKVIDDHEVELA